MTLEGQPAQVTEVRTVHHPLLSPGIWPLIDERLLAGCEKKV